MTEKRKVRVLLVDDEAHVRLLMKSIVAAMGCEVAGEAANGVQAMELFDAVRPDLVLLDINMPVMDGFATLRAIREKSSQVVVVMLTSVASAEAVERCLEAGADYHLRKDVPLEEMKLEIRETWLEHGRRVRDGAGS
jgi:two-component system, chemotaxis family, chemotaxis protein CheY